jgi:indolepyruvate ferredoxin oxidoreductase beta subunit
MNVLIAAVGGQGALLSARVLGRLGLLSGLDVKVSEIHGMSQRGGSVVTHVRMGKQICSPVVEVGTADVILGFELLEGFRAVPYLKEGGILIVNDQRISPMPVLTGNAVYPETLVEQAGRLPIRVWVADALATAVKAGNVRAVNMVLLGMMSRFEEYPVILWKQAISMTVPPKTVDLNLKAFELGVGMRCDLKQEAV